MRFIFLLRIHHWVKNGFIFIPAFFAGSLFEENILFLLIQGFFCFSLVSSAVYIFNDYCDIEIDRLHPTKKNRPLPSRKVSLPVAFVLMGIITIVGMAWAYAISHIFFFFVLGYAVINLLYSIGLKNIPLLDIFLISSGFLIRTVAGGVLIDVPVSHWLVIMVFLLSLFLAFAKRRDDLILAQKAGTAVLRKSSRHYTIDYINTCLALISGVIMVSYIMYTVSEEVIEHIGADYIYVTALFVFGGILRYLQITFVSNSSGSPIKILLTDIFMQVTIICWVLIFLIVLYA